MEDEVHDEAVAQMMYGQEDDEKQKGWNHLLSCTECLLRLANACAAQRSERGGELAMYFRQKAASLLV